MLISILAGCQGIAPEPRPVSQGHVSEEKPENLPSASEIPEPVKRTPFVPEPVAEAPVETYTVVVNDVPVKELLFALARDAAINVDIHPDVSGLATLNAVDQTLPQILNRLAAQLELRYEIDGDNISIQPDTPFVRIYRVDYVNVSRESTTSSSVSTEIASTSSEVDGGGGSGGGNSSQTTVTSNGDYPFWETLVETVRNLVSGRGEFEGLEAEETVIANPSNGVLMVRATGAQHEEVQRYLDEVKASSRRQVLIEVTIVEVQLSDGYQAGVDWSALASDAGLSVTQALSGTQGVVNLVAPPLFELEYADSRDPVTGLPDGGATGAITLLKQFGDTKVLSSPKVMALNNQTALLKVVENVVYFEVKSQQSQAALGGTILQSAETTARSVSVGVVMSVTPQISATDEVTLVVRPTISRVVGTQPDPNPILLIPNLVPEIAVREMESVLRVGSGQLAVLGGLMQDTIQRDSDGVPWISESEYIGDLFNSRNNQYVKTELVIFLRPWVIRTPDVEADLKSFQPFLPKNLAPSHEPVTSRFLESEPPEDKP